MDLDQLQSVRDRERQTDTLQQLRESFYADAAAFVQDLQERRDRAAEEAEDPFRSSKVQRLSDRIQTAEQTVEAIYEQRVGKIVKAATFAAADLPTEAEGLTAEERELFETLVADIEANRRTVFGLLHGEDGPAGATGDDAGGPDEDAPVDAGPGESDEGVSAADVMGGEPDDVPEPPAPEPPEPPDTGGRAPDGPGSEPGEGDPVDGHDGPSASTGRPGDDEDPDEDGPRGDGASDEPPDPQARDARASESTADSGADGDGEDVKRRTVRITTDVGRILGVDEREYDLSEDDVVTLPAANAEPLLDGDAAEPIE